ncbi:MAG: cytochrome c maturation protein CcmE [candidate division KSB1 bacterium]|nr:cytochrome c maturation protein CcmE [candidate division KSB1 bacterium]
MRNSPRTLVGAVILVGGALAIVLSGTRHSYEYFQTVSEFARASANRAGQGLRINGLVDSSSVHWEPDSLVLRFRLTDGVASVPVEYRGAAPDLFQAGQNVVVEGKMTSTGVFEATKILVKCPSKYEPQMQATETSR